MNIAAIELKTGDGIVVRGQHWPGGDAWIILLHDLGQDLDCWQPLMQPLLARGYSLLTLDLRGHGASGGDWDAEKADLDVIAALEYARQRDPEHLFLVAAGVSGLAALKANSPARPDAMALLSPGPLQEGHRLDDFRGPGIDKLFLSGSKDEKVKDDCLNLRNRSIGWALLVNLPTTTNGTALLESKWGLHVQEHILGFFHQQRSLSGQHSQAGPGEE